jgi:hypothetical protein
VSNETRLTPNAPVDNVGAIVARLRSRLRDITTQKRLERCAVAKCKAELGVWVSGPAGTRVARAVGVLTCNSVHVCPVCARKVRARRMAQLSRALRGALDALPLKHWRMLSVTIRHHVGMPLRWLRDGLMKAWRRCRQHGYVQAIFKKHVSASARAFEVTHSFTNGWHPHLHVALCMNAWSDDERATLDRVWSQSVVDALTHVDADNRRKQAKCNEGYHVKLDERRRALECRPDKEHGIRWSQKVLRRGDEGSKLEAYLTDIGLELSLGSTKTTHRESSRTPWQIAEHAVAGNQPSVRLWHEYENGVKGTRCIELDDRAAAYASAFSECFDNSDGEGCESPDPLTFEGAPLVGEEAVYTALHPEMMTIVRAYERIDHRATKLWLEAAVNTPGPLTAAAIRESVDACIRGMVSSLERWQLAHRSPFAHGDALRASGRGAMRHITTRTQTAPAF